MGRRATGEVREMPGHKSCKRYGKVFSGLLFVSSGNGRIRHGQRTDRILVTKTEPAAVTSIMLWLITFASCCIVGLPLLLREGWSMGELKQMAVKAEHQAEDAALSGELGNLEGKRP